MKPYQLHCTPVSVSNAGYSILSPGLYTGISVSDKVYEDQCQLYCYPVYQSVTQGRAACHLKCTPKYRTCEKVYEDLPATLYLDASVSKLGYTLGVYKSTRISVSDKVYEDLSATLFPCVSVSNLGYNGLSPGMFLEYRSTDIVYPGV